MKIRHFFILVIMVFQSAALHGQDWTSKGFLEEGWSSGGSIGFDLLQLAFVNPRIGAGSNSFGLNGLVNVYGNYYNDRMAWENQGSVQLAIQRNGKGTPYQKNLDIFRLNSRLGIRTGNERLFVSVDWTFETLMTKTYVGNLWRSDTLPLLGKFFSPTTMKFSPGVDYKYDEELSIFVSPISFKFISVSDLDIAKLNIHGNDPGSKTSSQLGMNVRLTYRHLLWEDRVSLTSSMDLYSNYRRAPYRIDILWQNDVAVSLLKNFSVNLLLELFYDYDVKVQRDMNKDGQFQDGEWGRGVSLTESILFKYTFSF